MTTLTPTSGGQPDKSQTRASITRPSVVRVPLKDLTHDPAFSPRPGIAKGHVHDLIRTIRRGTELDPIKVWRDPETGRLIILDGRHRATAYRETDARDIPAVIFQGDRNAARLEVGRDNSKTFFPWTRGECTQYAWGLVIDGAGSKRDIVQAANVSTGTVTAMRKRLAEITATEGATPSRNWWKDRKDGNQEQPLESDTDAAKQARVAHLIKSFREAEAKFKDEFKRRPTSEELGLANMGHLGLPRFKAMASGGFMATEDEFCHDVELHPLEAPPQDLNEPF
jgi:hypothetical protein